MFSGESEIWIGDKALNRTLPTPSGSYVQLMGETYYRIAHVNQMPPFFMSLVSSADHWLFIASTGGLTAGRMNAESALFPYETEDKVTAHGELTGSKTIIQVARNGRIQLWEPFSDRYAGLYQIERHLYKNSYGNKLIFEEVNHDLGLTMRTAWRTGDRFGFIRTCWLQNDSSDYCQITLLDGLQNILPYGANTDLQTNLSSLLNAYKRNELEPQTGLGLFTLSATLTDQAEPSESLMATTAWQVGLAVDHHLLNSGQMDGFRYGRLLISERDECGKAGAYLVNASFDLLAKQEKEWHIVADVNQDGTAVTQLIHFLQQDQETITQAIQVDIDQGTTDLVHYVASADGLQQTAQQTTTTHHFANTLFNIMRGGIFADGYQISREDLLDFVEVRNRKVLETHADWFAQLPSHLHIRDLYNKAKETEAADLIRLCYEYLPLTFSRRHGDPSRPWNYFSINLTHSDGSPRLDYQGNWRDIFQNWEPLAIAFPDYIEGIIAKFLNATTADGYNPYRITRDGIEWESPEPHNSWSNIGYWSDHQIIYLQKLLELAEQVHPGSLARLWNHPVFAYANVPYRLKPYQEMLTDWYDTIDFDAEQDKDIETAVTQFGTDGRLLHDANGNVHHATMAEKLLVLLLVKLTNLVPEGGIWMNTQRPEWNDANNALVGKGISVVTAAYLNRFITFWLAQLNEHGDLSGERISSFSVNSAVATLFTKIMAVFTHYQPFLESGFTAEARLAFMDELGTAVTTYRSLIYESGIPQAQTHIDTEVIRDFLSLAQSFIEQTLRVNFRPDGLAHTYNILNLSPDGVTIENLYLMLEGQVALLSAGFLTSEETVRLLDELRHSDLYRAEQHSYMLYPNRALPGFLQKNNVSANQVADSKLVAALTTANDNRLLIKDVAGMLHFNGRFTNADNVVEVLNELAREPAYAKLVQAEQGFILDLFETTFNHTAFTGRSGTFFAYEGLGSIYWHMVSKLLLAVQEYYQQAIHDEEEPAIIEKLAMAYYDIRQGLGYNKSPDEYGAFPTDPYSHTPMGGGARQPGMTGQVKEEILTRWGELGVSLQDGQLHFSPSLLLEDELLADPKTFDFIDVAGVSQSILLPPNSLAFTYCQTPIIYTQGTSEQIEVEVENGRSQKISGNFLNKEMTRHILNRDAHIQLLRVTIKLS